jgi:hypothetical protein
MADGYIGSFATEYVDPETRLFWHPVTAIREAGHDGNPATTADPGWTPLRTTPPIPDYDSAHAAEGGAAAAVLTAYFGHRHFFACSVSEPATDNRCVDATNSGPALIRRYWSFAQTAHENALSRIYVGYHFRKAAMDGNRHGRLIGRTPWRRRCSRSTSNSPVGRQHWMPVRDGQGSWRGVVPARHSFVRELVVQQPFRRASSGRTVRIPCGAGLLRQHGCSAADCGVADQRTARSGAASSVTELPVTPWRPRSASRSARSSVTTSNRS